LILQEKHTSFPFLIAAIKSGYPWFLAPARWLPIFKASLKKSEFFHEKILCNVDVGKVEGVDKFVDELRF
jgi:hypothetical protein